MALIVQKFGGSSVKDRDRIFNVARIVANTHNAGNDVVVVVSAQGDTTDDLITKAAEITHNPSAREMDMLLAAGEEISIALLAMALNELGCHATSLTGWQAGFRTDRAYTKARITKLETERISSELERNRVVVVAGFQGLNKLDDITTLGRGGSDTSAVAIAAAQLGASGEGGGSHWRHDRTCHRRVWLRAGARHKGGLLQRQPLPSTHAPVSGRTVGAVHARQRRPQQPSHSERRGHTTLHRLRPRPHQPLRA